MIIKEYSRNTVLPWVQNKTTLDKVHFWHFSVKMIQITSESKSLYDVWMLNTGPCILFQPCFCCLNISDHRSVFFLLHNKWFTILGAEHVFPRWLGDCCQGSSVSFSTGKTVTSCLDTDGQMEKKMAAASQKNIFGVFSCVIPW